MARDFPGAATSYLSVGDVASVDITGNYLSIATWFNPDQFVDGSYIIGKAETSTTTQYLVRQATGDVIRFAIGDGTGQDIAETTDSPRYGNWNLIVAVKTLGEMQTALNGREQSPVVSNKSIQNTNRNCLFGIRHDLSASTTFDGKIAHTAIWDATLTAYERLLLWMGVSPLLVRRGNLRGYWPMIDGPTSKDRTQYNANATMTGSVPVVPGPSLMDQETDKRDQIYAINPISIPGLVTHIFPIHQEIFVG
jgi:hypothetical protein